MLGVKRYNSEQVKPLDFERLDSADVFNSSIFEKKKVFCNQCVAEDTLTPLLKVLGNLYDILVFGRVAISRLCCL
jgi:hypothetical protein